MWEHPMDEHFRQLFAKEKAKLTGVKIDDSKQGSKRMEGLKSGTFGDSKEDPLLRAEREKRLKERSD